MLLYPFFIDISRIEFPQVKHSGALIFFIHHSVFQSRGIVIGQNYFLATANVSSYRISTSQSQVLSSLFIILVRARGEEYSDDQISASLSLPTPMSHLLNKVLTYLVFVLVVSHQYSLTIIVLSRVKCCSKSHNPLTSFNV